MTKLSLRRKLLLALAALVAVVATLFANKTPSHNGDWTLPQRRLPTIAINDNDFSIAGIRDFRYDANLRVVREAYIDEHYQFNDLQRLWFGLSHFGDDVESKDNGLAHAFLSFEFTGNRFLALSIEARLQQGQQYHPLKGLLRNYSKIYLFGTEADIIGLRSHHRHERVLLYPLNIDRDTGVALLRRYLAEAQALEHQAAYYNTLTDNCLTGLLRASGQFTTWDFVSNSQLILPGHSDELAVELKLIDSTLGLSDLRDHAKIDATIDPNDANFSQAIRARWSSDP